METWEYRIAYIDFRGRISIEGDEIYIEPGERRSAFVRKALDSLGKQGWELAGVHPLWPAETSYMVFKRPATGQAGQEPATGTSRQSETQSAEGGEPTRSISGEGEGEGQLL